MYETRAPYPFFADKAGKPISGGRVYFGAPNQNPKTAPQIVYWDAAGTQPAAQPISLTGGVPYRSGTPARLYTVGEFSVLVEDSAGALVCYEPAMNGVPIASVSFEKFGAVGDNSTNNDAALGLLVAYVNSITLSNRPVAVEIGDGIFKYGAALLFNRPVYLFSRCGGCLNYTGNDKAVRLGPDGITGADVFSQGEYTVDGVRFMGGASAIYGIYINEYVIEPRIRNVTFEDYGNSSSYDIYAQYQNWDIIIENCRKLTYYSTTAVGNFIAAPGRKRDNSAYDGGNSRITIRDCWMTSYAGQNLGYFAYVNAMKSRIIGGGFQKSSGGILLGGYASATVIDGVYSELSTPTSPYYVQALSIDTGSGVYAYPQQVTIKNGYTNMHQEVIGSNGRVIAAGDANVKLSDWTVENHTVSGFANGQALVTQNDTTGQMRNSYKGFKFIFVPAGSDNGWRPVLRGSYTNAESWASFDAEYGSWTPSLGGSATYTARSGTYTRNGMTITATFDITVNAIGTGSTSAISGLPVAADKSSGGSVAYFSSLALSVYSLFARIDGGTSVVTLTGLTAAAATTPGTLAVLGSGTRVVGTITYPLAAGTL